MSGGRIRFHFWFSTYGTIALVLMHVAGGMWQASAYGQFDSPLENAVAAGRPYAIGSSVAWVFIIVSNVMFLYHLSLMVFRLGRRSESPTMLGHSHGTA